MLYNDFEIIYVRRGKVGIAEGVFNSTVNGVVEFPPNDHEREIFRRDPIGYSAYKEALNELYLDIDPTKIRWLACAATLDESRVSLLGMSIIEKRAREILEMKEAAREGREVEEIKWIPPKYSLSWLSNISLQPLPWIAMNAPDVAWKKSISLATVKKLLNTTRKGKSDTNNRTSRSDEWHPLGAATMLLVLASLRPVQKRNKRDAFVETLRNIRNRLN